MNALHKQRADALYQLGLGDILHDFGSERVTVLCVPGGWMFTYHFSDTTSSVYVPYNEEFMSADMKAAQK